jgi:hypothetical protein
MMPHHLQAILNERFNDDGVREFSVRWKRHSAALNSWEPLENLAGCSIFHQYVAAQTLTASDFVVGEKVMAKYINTASSKYPAAIAAANSDGTYDIDWDDGGLMYRTSLPAWWITKAVATGSSATYTTVGNHTAAGIRRPKCARCAFFGRNLHSRMPLDPTHVRLTRTRV